MKPTQLLTYKDEWVRRIAKCFHENYHATISTETKLFFEEDLNLYAIEYHPPVAGTCPFGRECYFVIKYVRNNWRAKWVRLSTKKFDTLEGVEKYLNETRTIINPS